jgi:putative mRNA 3-end processing factor
MARKRSSPALPKERMTRRKPASGDNRRRRVRPGVSPLSRTGGGEVEVLQTQKPFALESSPNSMLFDEPHRDFEYIGGIHLTNSILWCDSDRRRDLSFVSHAHTHFVGKNRRILATDKTVKILTRKSGKLDALTSPYKRSFTLGPLRLELHPAGHVLGSSQLVIDRDDRRLVFASDVCPRRSATVERARPIPCDSLVICPSYGHPMYRFPERDEVFEQMTKFIDDSLNDSATPVLFANTIGTSQELMRRLGDAGYKLRVHASIYDVAKVYRSLGVSMHGSRRFSGKPGRDDVVLFPPILKKHVAIRKLKKSNTAIISGRAIEPGYALQQRVSAAFAYSDTADYYELIDFIHETGAREVYLYGDRFIEDFGANLRRQGHKVIPLVQPKQLNLL